VGGFVNCEQPRLDQIPRRDELATGSLSRPREAFAIDRDISG